MEKDIISRINISMKDGEQYGAFAVEGKANEILAMATGIIHATLDETPENRSVFRREARRILRQTRPDWIDRLVFYAVGVVVIFAVIALVGNALVGVAKLLGVW